MVQSVPVLTQPQLAGLVAHFAEATAAGPR